MAVLTELVQASVKVVEAGTFLFKIDRICSEDMLAAGAAALAFAGMKPEPGAEVSTAELQDKMKATNLKGVGKHVDAVVCAAVSDIGSGDPVEWDDSFKQFTLDKKQENTKAGKVWIGRLPSGVVFELFGAIIKHSNDDGRSADVLTSFPGGAEDSAAG